MKIIIGILAALSASSAVASIGPPSALPPDEFAYTFEAYAGQFQAYDGTTIIIKETPAPDVPVSSPLWYPASWTPIYLGFNSMLNLPAFAGNSFYPPSAASETPFSFSQTGGPWGGGFGDPPDITSANALRWSGTVTGIDSVPGHPGCLGSWLVSSTECLWAPYAGWNPWDNPAADPFAQGYWVPDNFGPRFPTLGTFAVPDTGYSAALLAAAVAGLAAAAKPQRTAARP